MPVQVQVDDELLEFPDDMSDDDIQAVLQREYPSQDTAPESPAISEADASTISEQLRAQDQFQQNLRAYTGGSPMSSGGPDMDFARALYQGVPKDIGAGIHTLMKPVEAVARPVFAQIRRSFSPTSSLMTGEVPGEFKEGESYVQGLEPPPDEAGIIPSVRRAAAGVTTPGNLLVSPLLGGGGSLAKGAQGVFAIGAASAVPGAVESLATAKTPAEVRGALTDIALNTTFAGLMGREAIRANPRAEAIGELRRSLEGEPQLAIPVELARPSMRELGIPAEALTAEPFLQPGVRELAGEALREAQGPRLEIPGELSALERLRREIEPPVIEQVEPTRLAERVPGGGEAPYGKVSYRREAEAPTTERTQNAIQQEATGTVPNVRQSEVTQTGEVQVPVSEGSPKAAEARVTETIESVAATKPGEFFSQAERWSKEAMSPEGGVNPQFRAELVALRNPDVAAWQQALSKASAEFAEIRDRAKADPNLMSSRDFQHEFSGAAQKSQFFSEGLAVLEGRKAADPRTLEMFNRESAKIEPDPIISKLESMKFPEKGDGRLYSLPHPDAIKSIGRSTWNSAVDVAIASVKAGKALAQAVDDALAYLRRQGKAFDEMQARANMEYVAREEAGAARTTTFPTEGESVKMRKSAERATTSEMIPEPVQETIKTAPESFYTQQSMKRVEQIVTEMPDADLATVPRDSNLYTAAKLEQANRLFKRGDNEAGYNVFVELEKEGTRLGQLINQFKMLKGTRPEEVARVINTSLQKAGKDPLNKAQEKVAVETARKSKEADTVLDESTAEWQKNPTPENAAKAEKSLLDANEAGLELQRFISKYQPRSTASIIKSVLQGNLLTPISEVANLVGNTSFLPFRAADRGVATTLDIINNYLRGAEREVTVQPVRGTVEALKGFGRGMKQVPDIFMRGTGDVIKGETRAGLHPIQAWINQFAKNPEMPTTKGKLTLQDRVNLAIEGTFGVPAEAMLRGLGAGDVGFKEAARARATATELQLAKVPKSDWSFAQKFPELFLDAKALERIQSDTLQAVFQRPSNTLNVITNWIRGRGEWFDLALATVAPYKLTPWNIVGEILSYNPLVAFARSISDYKKGNSRAAKLNAGKYVVGSALTAAGWWLYKNGLMSPSLDQRDEAQKARVLSGEVMPPNHINLSGLKRALAGGDPSFKPGDETADVFRAGGLAGSMFYMTANIGRDFERMPEVPDSEIWGAILRQSTMEQARFGMNQSFLSGVEGLLSAVREGNADNYIRQWGNTVASIPMPNSLTVMSRASREYKPDFREDTFRKQMENIVRNKLGVAGLDDYLPLKRDLWGEPMRETPEGRNAIMYHFFDVFKNKQVTSDPVPLELFRLWRKTTDSRVIPSLPDKSITVGGNTYNLTAEQQSRYAELVGKSRRQITDAVVVNPNFHKLPDEAKIDLLDRIYRAGQDRGKVQFWNEVGGPAGLSVKPQRAGFAPE